MKPKILKLLKIIIVLLVIGLIFLIYKSYIHYFKSTQEHSEYIAEISDLFDNSPSHYYVHTNGSLVVLKDVKTYPAIEFDSNNIPMINFKGKIGKQYNPVTISNYALENFELFLGSKETRYYREFLNYANWLCDNQHEGRWFYNFENSDRHLKSGWISAMAQGLAISVLVRAWQLSHDDTYLNCANKSFEILKIDNSIDGVSFCKDNLQWFEEYPDSENPTHVLNGHIWTLFGIWDYYRVTQDSSAHEIFKKGINALLVNLHKYDTGYWVLYDQGTRHLLSGTYMDLQIDQLKVLYYLTGENLFLEYAEKWEKYSRNFFILPVLVFVRLFS